MNGTLLRLPEVLSRLGRTRSMIYADVDRGLFPAPIKVGRTSCWRDDEVQSLLDGYTAGLDHTQLIALCTYITRRRRETADRVRRLVEAGT